VRFKKIIVIAGIILCILFFTGMPGYRGTFYLDNMLDFEIKVNGEFADPGTIGEWVTSVPDETGTRTSLSLTTVVKDFSFIVSAKIKAGFFSWSYRIGIEKIPPLNILRVACSNLIISDENDNILYTLDTIEEKDIIKDDYWGNCYLQIR
jgi:hypothetical protein